jgi:hypothetical protein
MYLFYCKGNKEKQGSGAEEAALGTMIRTEAASEII